MDLTKIDIIAYFPPPTSVNYLRNAMGHTRYYCKFIRGYAKITAPMEKLLKKHVKLQWNKECQKILDILKENMVSAPILFFSYCCK